jgi:hypothetical protein
MVCVSQVEDDHCIWYGQCFTDEKGKIKNCYRLIDAPVLQDPVGLQILNKRCPHLHVDNGERQFLCKGTLEVLQNKTLQFFETSLDCGL